MRVGGENRHGSLSLFAGVGGYNNLKRLGGVLVEGDPEESLYVQPVLRLPLPFVAHDVEEFGKEIREAAII